MYIVIAGGGKVGEHLASSLLESGHEVAIIERDVDVADRLSMVLQGRYLVIRGDGCDTRYQNDAGINKADVFVAATGQDDSNLVSCQIAAKIYAVPRCIARVNSPTNQRIFSALEIDFVSATEMIVDFIEEETLMGSVNVVSSLTHGDVILSEISVPSLRAHPKEEGVLVYDVEMPEDSIIVAVSGPEGVEVVGEETRMYPGDTAVVVADRDRFAEIRAVFRSL